MTPLLVLEGLTIRARERTLVTGVGTEVVAGRVTALVGPSGAGKSLTARACMGIIDPNLHLVEGRLCYPEVDAERDLFEGAVNRGERGSRAVERRTRPLRGAYVTYAPQAAASALNPGRTIGWQLQMAVRRRADPPADEESAISGLLERVGLEQRTCQALPSELSGGMCQRAALAVAVAPDPRIVVADEPETGLDPVLRRAVVELMVAVVRERDCGLVLISHHEDTVARIADDVVRLSGHGVVAERGAS